MTADFKKIGLPRIFAGSNNHANRKGVRYVSYAQGGGAADLSILYSIHPPNFQPCRGIDARRDIVVAAPHGDRHAACGRTVGPGTLERFSPRAMPPGPGAPGWPLAKVLAHLVVELIPPEQRVVCAVDDTNPQHKGKRVYGKGRHHPGAPGSFHAQSYGLGVGTQMGGVSDQCAVSVCPPSLGAAGALRPVSSVPARRETYRKADGIPARRDRFIWPINSWPC